MPVINGVYLKDFTALPGAVADADIIPIAITGDNVAYRKTVAGIVTDARITAKLLTGLSVTGGAVIAADTILEAFGKVQNQINNKQDTITLTTTGTSGAATLISNTLNIPNYADGGVLSLSAIGGTANANAATITGTVLNLQPADASFGGVVTTGTQTFAGDKTFTDVIKPNASTGLVIFSNLVTTNLIYQAFQNTGGQMKFGISSSAGSAIFSNESAYATVFGSGNATSLQFATNNIVRATFASGGDLLLTGTVSSTPQGTLYGTASASITSSQLATSLTDETGTGSVVFSASPTFTGVPIFGSSISNGTYTYTLPSATGTLALTSALSSYLPLIGGILTGSAIWNTAYIATDLQNTSYIRFSNSGGATRWGYIQHDGTDLAFFNDISAGKFTFNKPLSGTSATFSSSVTATSFSNAGLQSGEVFNGTKSNAGYFVGYLQNTSATGLGLYIQNGSDTLDALRIGNAAGSANNIQLYGSGKAYFASNVGIGTTSPATNFQIAAAAPEMALQATGSLTSGSRGNYNWYNSSISTVASIKAVALTDNVGTGLEFYTRPVAGSLTKTFDIASTGAATFTSNLTLGSGATLYMTAGDIQFVSNAGYGILTADSNRLISIQNGAFGVNGAATFSSTITTAAPSGGTAKPFKIGNVATVTPTSQNRTIEIEIDGTTYYLTAKTTNN
jgi:hypothetical protein